MSGDDKATDLGDQINDALYELTKATSILTMVGESKHTSVESRPAVWAATEIIDAVRQGLDAAAVRAKV